MGRAARNQPGTCKRAHLIVDKGTQRALGAAPLQEEHTVGLCLGVPKRRDLVLRAQGGPTHRQSQPSVRTPPYPTLPCPCAHRVVAEGAGAALGARAAQVVGAVGQLPRVKAADLHLAALLLLLLLSSGGCRLGSRRLEGGRGACTEAGGGAGSEEEAAQTQRVQAPPQLMPPPTRHWQGWRASAPGGGPAGGSGEMTGGRDEGGRPKSERAAARHSARAGVRRMSASLRCSRRYTHPTPCCSSTPCTQRGLRPAAARRWAAAAPPPPWGRAAPAAPRTRP